MKVVHLSTTDYGGAYKAAARISESMKQCGVDSEVLIRTKTCQDTVGTEIFTNPIQKIVSKMKNLFNLVLSEGEVVSDYLGTNVSKHPLVQGADVVVLHWVNSFISYKNVEQLIRTGKPLIWVMHDMWLFTGGCHIDQYCGGYEHGCGNCPYLKHKKERDISRKNFLRKVKMLGNGQITLVGPSQWIVDCAQKSGITNRLRINRIPNPIDTIQYRPMKDKADLRKKYGVDFDKKIILYGAVDLSNLQKGGAFVLEAFKELMHDNYSLVLFGRKPKKINIDISSQIHFLGYISAEEQLMEVYNIADVVIMTSYQENYPNTILEAAACEIPVVAFNIGGIPDIVKHIETGYLVNYGDVNELVKGIRYCIENKVEIGIRARQHIEENNRYEVIGYRYKEVVQRCIEENGRK